MCVITAYGVQCLGCWLSEVRCWVTGYGSRMRDVARLHVENELTLADGTGWATEKFKIHF